MSAGQWGTNTAGRDARHDICNGPPFSKLRVNRSGKLLGYSAFEAVPPRAGKRSRPERPPLPFSLKRFYKRLSDLDEYPLAAYKSGGDALGLLCKQLSLLYITDHR